MKQSTKKSIGIVAAALILVGCNEIKFDGIMNVLEQITFSQSQGKKQPMISHSAVAKKSSVVLSIFHVR